MSKGKFEPKRTKLKSGWKVSRVDGRTKLGKALTSLAKKSKSGKRKVDKFKKFFNIE